jgi:hypothetical protein
LRVWFARFLIVLVIVWNLQAAFAFLFSPETFASGFELSGIPGQAAMRGIAVLFIMWNVPYILAAWHPLKHNLSLKEALVMQVLGLTGETGILLTIPQEHVLLQSSILRFISFDAAGLVALALAFWLVRAQNRAPTDNLTNIQF